MQFNVARLVTMAALSWSAAHAIGQTVTPPPLPPGHNLIRPDAGLNEDERKRYVRAHHHKMHNKKDVTRDDSAGRDDDHDDRGRGDGNRGKDDGRKNDSASGKNKNK